jgi:hypothetical protein
MIMEIWLPGGRICMIIGTRGGHAACPGTPAACGGRLERAENQVSPGESG